MGGTDEGTATVEAEVGAPTGIVAMKSALMGDVVLAKTRQTKALTNFPHKNCVWECSEGSIFVLSTSPLSTFLQIILLRGKILVSEFHTRLISMCCRF